eukprot:jgi/Chlat1/7850/Chrsp66S07297
MQLLGGDLAAAAAGGSWKCGREGLDQSCGRSSRKQQQQQLGRVRREQRSHARCMAKKSGGDSGAKDENGAPPRVVTHLPLKHQLRYIKLIKEIETAKAAARAGPKAATSYRRKKKADNTDEDSNGTLEEEALSTGKLQWYHVLLVDGYNVCMFWPRLKKRMERGDLDGARTLLVHDLGEYASLRGMQVVVVFDAGNSPVGDNLEVSPHGVDIVYSSAECADTWIEAETLKLRDKGFNRFTVATSDGTLQKTAEARGANIWPCRLLVQEINRAKREAEEKLQGPGRWSKKGLRVQDSLDQDTALQLHDLKRTLEGGRTANDR